MPRTAFKAVGGAQGAPGRFDSFAAPLTLGTAGHVDHGKTALVRALTGVDTDRLPEERARGLTIVLGYAPLALPGDRRISLVDVPGHERFVRTMVAGASGIDVYLMVVAADDGVMPQTVEHARVLEALGVERGVVAVTKCDIAEPARAAGEARALLPGAPVVACSAVTGAGIEELRCALGRLATSVPSRAALPGAPRLHVDRVFSVRGRGTVVTGTLWSGELALGDELELAPARLRVRVRGLQVHDRDVSAAPAGQRVAVNLSGARASAARRGEALTAPGQALETRVLDCELRLRDARHGMRVQVHHGTRAVAARLAQLDGQLWQLRLEQPVLALDGDRVVVRRLAPPDTLGGGRVLDARARRHGARVELLDRLRLLAAGHPVAPSPPPTGGPEGRCAGPATTRRPGAAQAAAIDVLERRLLDAGMALLSEAQLDDGTHALAALRDDGRAVRVSGRLYAHRDVAEEVCGRIVELLERDGATTLAAVRDELGASRKSAQAFLERLDALRVTRRLADNTRVLGPRARRGTPSR